MSKSTDDNTEPRRVPVGSCSWCGHPPHSTDCAKQIRVAKGEHRDCPCRQPELLSA